MKEIIRELPKLSQTDLHLLSIRISALKSIGLPQVRQDFDDMAILDCIQKTMSSGRIDFSSLYDLKYSSQYRTFSRKVPALMDYLSKITLVTPVQECGSKRMKKYAATMLGVLLLAENMKELSLPVSSRLVMAQIHRIPAVINKAFPGYAQSGMLHLILRKYVP
jgi:hypothetical protein